MKAIAVIFILVAVVLLFCAGTSEIVATAFVFLLLSIACLGIASYFYFGNIDFK